MYYLMLEIHEKFTKNLLNIQKGETFMLTKTIHFIIIIFLLYVLILFYVRKKKIKLKIQIILPMYFWVFFPITFQKARKITLYIMFFIIDYHEKKQILELNHMFFALQKCFDVC